MGSPVGALVGGLLVGLSETLSAGYISSDYKDATAFIIILLALSAFRTDFSVRAAMIASRRATWFLQGRGSLLILAAAVLLLPLIVSTNFHYRVLVLVWVFSLAVIGLNFSWAMPARSVWTCRLLRARRLFHGTRAAFAEHATLGKLPAGNRIVGIGCIRHWTANPSAEGALSRGRHPRLRRSGLHGAEQRDQADGRPRRNAGRTAAAVRLVGSQQRHLVLITGGLMLLGAWLALNLVGSPSGARSGPSTTAKWRLPHSSVDAAAYKLLVS